MIRYFKFRKAIKEVIKSNYEFLMELAESERNEQSSNLTWDEDGVWKGWTYNRDTNRYYFDDIGNESIMGLWENQWAREAVNEINL
jgi:hypothetical protein